VDTAMDLAMGIEHPEETAFRAEIQPRWARIALAERTSPCNTIWPRQSREFWFVTCEQHPLAFMPVRQ
jgi:hypothetical protein